MKTKSTPWCLGLFLFLFLASTTWAQQGLIQSIRPEDAVRIGKLRSAGMQGDRSAIPALITELKKPSGPRAVYIVVHALAQLGAAEALPAIETAIQNAEDGDMATYAKVARARILAEVSAKNTADADKRAPVKLRRFLSELGLDTSLLNAARANKEQIGRITATHGARPVNLYALRDLADMIYQGRDLALAAEAKRLRIDFEQDFPAALKVRLAPLSEGERVSWLIEELSRARVMDDERYYMVQLAANSGRAASQAAAVKLREIRANREKYRYGGISALMQVIRCAGDERGATIVSQFLDDSDPYLAQRARLLLEWIRPGFPAQCRVTY